MAERKHLGERADVDAVAALVKKRSQSRAANARRRGRMCSTGVGARWAGWPPRARLSKRWCSSRRTGELRHGDDAVDERRPFPVVLQGRRRGRGSKAFGLQEAQNRRSFLSKREVIRTMSGQTAPVIFLSHSGVDTEAAKRLKRLLLNSPDARKAGLRVWFDKDDLRPGESWSAQIAKVIETEATAFVVYVGSRGVMNWVDAEVDLALSRATTETSSCSFPSGRKARAPKLPAVVRQALPGRPRPARRRRRVRETAQGRPQIGVGQGGEAHRRAIRRPTLDARGRGRPVLRPGGGGQ